MATIAGTIEFNGFNIQLQYDILSQSIENNSTTIRLYNIINVTNNYVAWSSGSAWVHAYSEAIGTYYSRGSYRLCYADFTFTHSQDGTLAIAPGYGINTTFQSGSSTAVIQLPTIARKITTTSAPDFNDETNSIEVSFTNPANFQSLAYINFYLGNQYQVYALRLTRAKSLKTSPYTWEFTNEEKEQMRTALQNDSTCNVSIGFTTFSGDTEIGSSSLQKKFSIVNATPIFNYFDVEEVNNTIKTLTGSTKNNIINVNGYSNIKATIEATHKAIAQKSASMIKYRFVAGDKTTDINYSSSEDVNGTINGTSNGMYNIFAIDSRGQTTIVQRLATTEKNYSKIVINKSSCKIERDNNQVGDNAILTLEGEFWNESFGQTTNDVVSITYKLKKTDSSTWIDGTTTITPTKSGNTFSFSGQIASDNQSTKWDLGSSYNVQIVVNDYLSSDTMEFVLNSAVPTLSLDKNGVGIMCAYDNNLGGSLQVEGALYVNGNEIKTHTFKTLWEGSFSSGTISVPNLSEYTMICVLAGGLLMVGNQSYGGMVFRAWRSETTIAYVYRYTYNATNETLTIDNDNRGATDGTNNVAITKIIGVF